MQSSVRADASRFPRPPSTSNDSVHISREVSIASTRASSPLRKGSFSTMPQIYSTHARRQTGSDAGTAAGTQQRWNSRTSVRSRSSVQSIARFQTPDPELLDNNRDSMKALAEFLMTKEPPPNHYMSMDPSEDEKALSPFRSAFSILGRNKRHKRKSQQLLQLPDSAVAARTSSGARYIAISIPLEHDQKYQSVERHVPPARQPSQRAIDRADRTAVTVLNPVHELHESTSSKALGTTNDEVDQSTVQTTAFINAPLTDIVEGQMHFNQPDQQQWKDMGSDQIPQRDPNRVQKSYFSVSPFDINRLQESDARHSGGTAYSTTSVIAAQAGHSRGLSQSSNAMGAGTSPLTVDLRNSTFSRIQHAEQRIHPLKQNPIRWSAGQIVQIERAQSSPTTAFEKSHGHVRGSSALSGQMGIESIATLISTGSTPSSPLVFTAGIARKYSNAANGTGPQLVRSSTPRALSGAGTSVPRPKTAPPGSLMKYDTYVSLSHFNNSSDTARRTASQREGSIADPRSSRRERVKARKLYDMAQARPKSSGHLSREIPNGIFALTSNNTDVKYYSNIINTAQPAQHDEMIPPKRSPRRRRNSQELKLLRNACTLSPIMLVAMLPPYTSLSPTDRETPTPTPSISTIRQFRTSSAPTRSDSNQRTSKRASQIDMPKAKGSIHTPPRSHSSSPSPTDSELESDIERERLAHILATSHQSLRSTLLATRRQERRTKRNIALREKDLDTRMLRIERDNKVLLRTLNRVADSFEEIRSLGMVEARGKQSLDVGGLEREFVDGDAEQKEEERRRRELMGMEPVIRDLVGGVARQKAARQRLARDFRDEVSGRE